MLSISTLHSFEYYVSEGLKETFSYYSGRGQDGDERERDPAGKWVGKYAGRLGLPAHAKIEDFAALYFGFDPNTGKPLTKSADQTGWQLFKVKQLLADENLTGPKRLRLEQRARKLSAEIAGRDKNSASSKKGNGAKGDDEEVAKPRKKSVHRPGVDLIHRQLGTCRTAPRGGVRDPPRRIQIRRFRLREGSITRSQNNPFDPKRRGRHLRAKP